MEINNISDIKIEVNSYELKKSSVTEAMAAPSAPDTCKNIDKPFPLFQSQIEQNNQSQDMEDNDSQHNRLLTAFAMFDDIGSIQKTRAQHEQEHPQNTILFDQGTSLLSNANAAGHTDAIHL